MRTSPATLGLTVAALAIAGCGGSTETTSYTTPYSELSSTKTAAPTPSPTPTPEASPSPTPTPAFNGTPVKGGKVTVVGTEFKFDPAALTTKPGKVQVTLDNQGSAPHEIVFIKTDTDAGALTPGTNGEVPEKGKVGGVSEIPGGQTKTATVTFKKPGHYVFVCNVPGHYQSGMHGTLVVQ
jgi:plastocyanin